jgi:hypothetical protein
MDWLPWAPLGAAMLHMSEQFVCPGGFVAWYRRYRKDASRITTRFLVIINAAALFACLDIGLLKHNGVTCWPIIAAMMCSNGIWHAWASYKSRSYSPGMITGVIIYVPLTAYGFIFFLRTHQSSVQAAIAAGASGGSYHLWSELYHRKAPG